MPTTIYTATNAWIPQAQKTVRKFASGLSIIEQEFLYPGTPSAPPKNEGDDFEGAKVFPQPSISTTSAGVASSTVVAYGVGVKISGPPYFLQVPIFEKIESKILKTGQAITTTNVVAQNGDVTSSVSQQDFKYLAARIQTKIACATDDLAAPVSPNPSLLGGNNADYFNLITPPSGNGFSLSKSWILSQYEVQNYGATSEVTYTYEVEAAYSRTLTA